MGLISFYAEAGPLELRADASEDDLQTVIRAAYKQVLGNAHVLDSDRLSDAESALRNGDITVRGFIRAIAQSAGYQTRFFSSSSAYRFIELNCKHLLGRAPIDQAEIAEHVALYNDQGYEAEINSYIDSEEYLSNFGENIVPYACGATSQVGIKNANFPRMFSLLRGPGTSDSSKSAQLISAIASNLAPKVKGAALGNGANYGNTGKRYEISVTQAGKTPRFKQSNKTISVNYAQLTQKIQAIQKTGGKITNITEV